MTEGINRGGNGAVAFRVYGLPVAQGRARAARLPGGAIRLYDPQASREWKQHVRVQALQAMGGTPAMLQGPLEMTLLVELPRPQSAPKRRRWPDRRPDLSNFLKACEDAVRGVVYLDDAQVVRLHADKHYGPTPGVEIRVAQVRD